jgi:RHS repeat-associated protein
MFRKLIYFGEYRFRAEIDGNAARSETCQLSDHRLLDAPTGSLVYAYNGLNDRLQETANGSTTTFTMDLNTGLTQALSDDTYSYTYGLGRIAQYDTTAEYFLGDALGSVRQLTDAQGQITLAKAYNPYGEVSTSAGAGQTSYGYTNEYQDGYNQLVYLRARHYAPSMGRFLTRDTWGGDTNKSLSFNRWIYSFGNPTNLTDPTGRRPEPPEGPDPTVHKYCYPLQGRDSLECQKILLGIDPDNPMSQLELILYQVRGECPSEPLYLSLPHSLGIKIKTFREYGWWWHYLMDKSSGSWKRPGESHVYLKDVIAYALGAELATYGNVTYRFKDGTEGNVGKFVAEAFARKAWDVKFGFYTMLGSRQSVMERVNTAIYGISDGKNHPYIIYTDTAFQSALKGFQTTLMDDSVNYNISGLAGPLSNTILSTTTWHSGLDSSRPYEWGNPTDSSPAYFKENLRTSNLGWDSTNVLYTSDNWKHYQQKTKQAITPIFFVLTGSQQQTLCGSVSCVTGD